MDNPLFPILMAFVVIFIIGFIILPLYVFWQFHVGAYSFEETVVALLVILCYMGGISYKYEA